VDRLNQEEPGGEGGGAEGDLSWWKEFYQSESDSFPTPVPRGRFLIRKKSCVAGKNNCAVTFLAIDLTFLGVAVGYEAYNLIINNLFQGKVGPAK
jgi:hypothetical protein